MAACAAGSLSGLPSTLWAVGTRRDVLEATRAAGTLMPGRRHRPGLIAGGAVHAVLSVGWTTFIAVVWRRRPLRPSQGAAVGLAIAALDLAVIGRRYPAIRNLPQAPQWVDHVAFGAVAGAFLSRSRAQVRRDQGTRR